MMRLFIGIGIPEETKETLWRTICGADIRGTWVPKGNYHITMAYLGARDEQQAEALETVLTEAARTAPPFALTVNGLGIFGRRYNALLYAGLAPCAPLAALTDGLRRLLTEAGEAFDPKPFHAHITLARKADAEAVDLDMPLPPVSFTADPG